MSGDEMFEKLGYKKLHTLCGITYYKDSDNVICFKTYYKSIYKSGEYDGMHDYITMAELQAINQKCKELGWIE